MRNNIYKGILAAGLILGFTACSSDDSKDTQKPTILLNAPKDGAKLEVGSDIHFDMEVSDNEMLGSYKIDIHENSDGHTHSVKRAAALNDMVEFSFQKQWSLEGQRNADVHHHEIVIPQNAELGKYHFVVYVLDAAGNQSMEARSIQLVAAGEGDVSEEYSNH
ncbi:DUF4625 domain-containing protein [Myroides guanonis]|uniref:DUF4625 domain-containing protein n=1 Tax=Myroides guanonis TaxID=1150112 RepID=A0A1I3MTT0_9FLAO|nr:DUF4625 domain-containing protein [Myroides guanonis]SFJ00387.1 protein of unknown function [Myroides guanonis]